MGPSHQLWSLEERAGRNRVQNFQQVPKYSAKKMYVVDVPNPFKSMKKNACRNNRKQDKITFASLFSGHQSNELDSKEQMIASLLIIISGVHIVVSTPGRLFDHMRTKEFDYRNVCCLVLDEADKIFQYGFEEDLKQIINRLPSKGTSFLEKSVFIL